MVNVIIPTYKAIDTLPKALDSLVAQTKKIFIVTIVQDCDNEDYSKIVDEYSRRGLQIQLLKTPINSGPGVARQVGIDNSSFCDYVMFLDSDDMYLPQAVELLYRAAKQQDFDIVASNFIVETQYKNSRIYDWKTTSITWLHGKIYKVNFLKEKNIRFREDLRANEDAYFNLIAFNCTERKTGIEEYTYIWRDNKNSITRNCDNFFKTYGLSYLKSQIYGLFDITNINGEIKANTLGLTLYNIYKSIMKLNYIYKIDYNEYSNEIELLRSKNFFKSFIEVFHSFPELLDTIKAGEMIGDEVFYYPLSFDQWLRGIN